MALLEAEPTIATGDNAAIADLHEKFAAQQAAFLAHPYPTADERRASLTALIAMMHAHVPQIVAAMQADFGSHPVVGAAMEAHMVAGRAEDAIANLERLMAPSRRVADPASLGTAVAEVRYQPKGVIGVIVPWNFPFDLAMGPLVDMLAAGNRVIIKPSDYTPACAALMAEMVAGAFPADQVTVVTGGVELARAFGDLRWDHLLYTGSPNVGREVMAAAARNLVPVTLELGGKCPAIMTPGSISEKSVTDVIGTKLIKNGQVCISVDYVLAPRTEVDAFVALTRDHFRDRAPGFSRGPDCTGIISERHLDRIANLIDDAAAKGATIVQPEEGGAVDRTTRRMPLTLVIDPPANAAVMREEIFGPVLPVVPYDRIDDAIAFVNTGERPLGLYVFGDDAPTIDRVLERTTSGGATVNACAMHAVLPNMGFGGIGQSGMGRHHGEEGFREFSNPRAVFVRGEGDQISAFYPPYPAM